MKHEYCLDIDDGMYKLGDLNLFMRNTEMIGYPPVDPENPKQPFFTGEIRQTVKIGEEDRKFLVYLPKHYPISGAGIFIFPDNGVSCETFLENENWKSLSEEYNVALIVLEARPGGWSRRDIQSEIEYGEKVFKAAIARVYFSINESTYYVMGFGAGAYPATAYTLLNSTLISGLVSDGDFQLDGRLLKQLATIQSDRDKSKSKLDVAVPAWLLCRSTEDGGAVLDCFRRACHTEDRELQTPYADVFQQNLKRYRNSPDGLPMTEVWFTGKNRRVELEEEGLHRRMIVFVMRFKRWLGIGNGEFRPARDAADMGLKRFTKEIDGRLREWFVYEPAAYRKDPEKKLPAVLAIHGYSCTGELFAENSEWHVIAERRDFFVVYVSAYPSNQNSGRRTVPLPTWNSIGMVAETDDVHYISVIMREFKSCYPVDDERVYVSGHSNGSLFTQRLMEETPAEYAAFAPAGAQYHLNLSGKPGVDHRRILKDGILRPVWLMMGHEDIGDQDSLEPGSANDQFIDMMCDVNGLDRKQGRYLENGKYHTYTYLNDHHVPLLRFTGVQDLPHAYTPEMAGLYWDQFFCHFRRKADGSVEYMD